MRRILFVLAVFLFALSNWSQTMNIYYKDGQVEKKDMSKIDRIEFTDGDEYETSATIYLERAGTLSSKLSKSQASELLKLKLSGHMDARDFDFIKWDCMKVEEVDLSDVVIDSYTGREGTEEGNNKTYAANEIPSGAFFYWINTHKYNYDGMPIDEGMPSLKKIVLPNGIKAIRRNAFARAYNLTEINIPEGVEAIDYVSFAICTSLEELRLPSSLKTVGQLAFADMTSLRKVYVSATTPPSASSNAFQGLSNQAIFYVPSGTENLYRNSVGWNTFSQIVGFGDAPNDNTNTDFDKNSIVGVWEVASYECSVPAESIIGDKMYLNADGTYSDPKSSGHWSLNNNQLLINYSNGNSVKYEILSLTATELSLKLLDNNISITMTLKREGTNEGGEDYIDGISSDGSEYFEITINGEKINVDSWGGSVLLNLAEKNINGTKMIPYGSNTDMIRPSDGRAYQFDVFVGYVEGDWFGKGHPKTVGSYDVISSEGQYTISNYSDNLGMVVRGGGSNNGPSDFIVKSGSMKITKVSKASSDAKYVPDKSELYATEGNFDFILHDKRYDEDITMSGKFRLIY